MTRAKYLAWAKQRAHKTLNRTDDLVAAIASMISDLAKHGELQQMADSGIFSAWQIRDRADCRRWIDGFK